MNNNYTMTFDETFRAIRGGDLSILAAFAIECAIMASPFVLFYGAWVAGH